MADACLDPKELKAKRKLDRKSLVKRDVPRLDMNALELDKVAFTEVGIGSPILHLDMTIT